MSSAPPAAKGKLLVVDDDRLVLATVVSGLEAAGFDVVDTDDGEEAIALARTHRPELALLDIRMQGLSGFDVARLLQRDLAIPFVFLSAFDDAATAAQVRSLGALDYLIKPLDVGQIVPAVHAALARVAAAAAVSTSPTSAAAPTEPPPSDPLAIAVGVLMQRHAAPRVAAWQRLLQGAAAAATTPRRHAERLLATFDEGSDG